MYDSYIILLVYTMTQLASSSVANLDHSVLTVEFGAEGGTDAHWIVKQVDYL